VLSAEFLRFFAKCFYPKKHQKLSEQKLLHFGAKNVGESDIITPQHLE
jgi:hypothetical protein